MKAPRHWLLASGAACTRDMCMVGAATADIREVTCTQCLLAINKCISDWRLFAALPPDEYFYGDKVAVQRDGEKFVRVWTRQSSTMSEIRKRIDARTTVPTEDQRIRCLCRNRRTTAAWLLVVKGTSAEVAIQLAELGTNEYNKRLTLTTAAVNSAAYG